MFDAGLFPFLLVVPILVALILKFTKAPVPKRVIWVLFLFPFAMALSMLGIAFLLGYLCGDCMLAAMFVPFLLILGLVAYLVFEFAYQRRIK